MSPESSILEENGASEEDGASLAAMRCWTSPSWSWISIVAIGTDQDRRRGGIAQNRCAQLQRSKGRRRLSPSPSSVPALLSSCRFMMVSCCCAHVAHALKTGGLSRLFPAIGFFLFTLM